MKYENAKILLHAENVENNTQSVIINCQGCTYQLEALKRELTRCLNENRLILQAIQKALKHKEKPPASDFASIEVASVSESAANQNT